MENTKEQERLHTEHKSIEISSCILGHINLPQRTLYAQHLTISIHTTLAPQASSYLILNQNRVQP